MDWELTFEQKLLPVTGVSHADAGAYAAWLGLRLPSETEWMAAAGRGDSFARYAWGDAWDVSNAVTSEDKSARRTSPWALAPTAPYATGTDACSIGAAACGSGLPLPTSRCRTSTPMS